MHTQSTSQSTSLRITLNSVRLYDALGNNDIDITGHADLTVSYCRDDYGHITNDLDIVQSIDGLDIESAKLVADGRKVKINEKLAAKMLDTVRVKRQLMGECGVIAWEENQKMKEGVN